MLPARWTNLRRISAGLFTQAADESHKDSVRVYRNVQASMIEELDKRVKILSDRLDEIAQKQAAGSGK
jgi:hypothetical protein